MNATLLWPAVSSCAVFVGWRLLKGGSIPRRGLGVYLAGMSLVSGLMLGAGYSGGEMLLTAGPENVPASTSSNALPSSLDGKVLASAGQKLFLKNCAHCHGADARGDEGPDLHNLDWTDEQIATRIRNGKKGQMTAFAGKLSADEIKEVIVYLRSLK